VAAEFGLIVAGAMLLFVAVLGRDLIARYAAAGSRAEQFLCRTSLLGLVGFIVSGIFDYTYGHSLGLIMLSFVVLLPLAPTVEGNPSPFALPENHNQPLLAATDRVMGLILASVLSPVILGSAGIVLVLSRRSPLVAHLRIGQGGRPFWMWKLRTMWPSTAPSNSERVWLQRIEADPVGEQKLEGDPRITSRFAALCRRHSIDELPQLLHVIRGEMSLVGPRPVTRAELTRHYGVDAEEVLRIKPGLTGYWQTQGRSRLSYPDRVSLDLALARTLSFGTYWSVMWRTLPEVLSGKNAR
jgi:exopolysaccharide production protein ExoY